jgi:hypothetical protein
MDRQVSCMTVAAAGFENGSPAPERQLKQESFTADQYHLLQQSKHSIAFNHTQAHEAHTLHAGRLPVFLHPTFSLPDSFGRSCHPLSSLHQVHQVDAGAVQHTGQQEGAHTGPRGSHQGTQQSAAVP